MSFISGNSREPADVSFSKSLLLTPIKPLEADKEQEVVVEIAGVKIDLDKSGNVDSFSSNPNTNFNRGLRNLLRLWKSNWLPLGP